METQDARTDSCPTEATLAVIGGRWKVPILWNLFAKTCRFGELHRLVGGATQKMLTQQLRELESDGLVHRKVFLQVPPRVEYSATTLGLSLEPVVAALSEWGVQYLAGRPRRRRRERKLSKAA